MNERNDTHLQKVPIPLTVKNPLPLFQNPPPDFPISFLFSTLPNEKQTKKPLKNFCKTLFKTRKKKIKKIPPFAISLHCFLENPKSKKSPLETFVKIPKEKSSAVYSLLNQFSKNRKNPFAQPFDWAYIASQLTNWSSSTTGIDSLNANSPRALESAMDSQLLTKPICAFVCNCECVYVTRVKNVNTISDKVGVEMAGVCRINSLARWRTWAKLTFMDPG